MRYAILGVVFVLAVAAGALAYEWRAPRQTEVPAIRLRPSTVTGADVTQPPSRTRPRRTAPTAPPRGNEVDPAPAPIPPPVRPPAPPPPQADDDDDDDDDDAAGD